MSKHIVEELPARKHAPAAAQKGAEKGGEKGGTEQSSEKRIRQAVYDIRYRARREDIDLKQAFSQYMSHSSLNQAERTAVRAKLFGKQGGVSEQYTVESVDWAVDNVASAMFKVFVEGVQKDEPIHLSYLDDLSEESEKKYKVRVTDPKTEKSYVRYATREKITQLRGRGLKVEMTEYGEPYEGERKRGEKTARALGGGGKKRLDPVGREDKDIDNDGDHDKTDKYLLKRREVRSKAIAMRKEDYLWSEETTSTEGKNSKKIDVMKNGETNNVKVFPQDGSDAQVTGGLVQAGVELNGPFLAERAVSKAQQRFMGMVYAVEKGAKPMSPEVAAAAKSMTKKEAKKFAKTKHKGLPEKVKEAVELKDRDTRADKTYRDVLKNKFRSMGVKDPIISNAPEDLENAYGKIATSDMIKGKDGGMCEETDKPKSALDIVRASVGPGLMTGKTKKPKPTAAQRKAAQKTSMKYIVKTSREMENDTRGT